ncbi:TonB-dependent receptor [Solimonas terrae]|uniref:TonB-dependent receptor n=1 Tax=Solimonas terrae TaxID=1396819 RepID=A0A6M2BNR4_9GAMM|nr:TonB-dependent receptor [Solimonas terrae]NGY04246.1 TonB-dependent receptor [Solimonas terrae]
MPKLKGIPALRFAASLLIGLIGVAAHAADPGTADDPADAAATPADAAAPAAVADGSSNTPAPLPTIPLPAGKAPAPPKADKQDDTSIAEVIVTAQKREERLQDVPLAITVIGKKQLEKQNISTTGDLARAAPAVEVNGEPGNPDTHLSIRGISTQSFSVTSEQAVSFVADGVVLGRAPSVSLFDIAQVEVLRGPQGTLFGKNSSAGVINVTTNKPDPGEFAAKLHADLSDEYDYRLLQGMINVPVSDNSALRIAAGQTYQSGFIHNNVTNKDSKTDIKGARARYLWDVTPDLRVNLIADYEKSYVSEQLYLLFSRYVDSKTGEPQPITGCGGAYATDSMRISCNGDPSNNTNEAWGFSGQIDWTLGDHTITSISSFRRYLQDGTLDVDGLPGMYYDNGNKFDNRVYSQELRIASPTGNWLEYVAGLYASKAHVPNYLQQNIGDDMLASLLTGTVPITLCATLQICLNGDVAQLQNPNTYIADLHSYAAFGQATMRFFDDWRFIVGARETRDEVEMTSTSYLGVKLLNSATPIQVPMNAPLTGNDTVDNFSWKLGLQYDVTPVSMAYLTVSHGYKGPQIVFNPPGIIPTIDGLNSKLPTPASISIVKPEYPMDYEIGFKTLLWGGFYANLNLFYTKIEDFQSQVFNAQGTATPNNIPSIVTKGVELDFFGKPFTGFTINGGFLYNPAVYPNYYVSCTQDGPQCGDNPNTEPTEDNVENIKGQQLTLAPRWKYTLATDYEHPLFWGMSGFVGMDAVYRSNIRFMAQRDTRTNSGAHTIVGARIGLRQPEQGWTLSLFVRNLFDERYAQFKFAPYLLSNASAPGIDATGQALSTESFRFIGLTLDYEF